jgi:hypothetical protein
MTADTKGVKLLAGRLQIAIPLATMAQVLQQQEVDQPAFIDA